MGVAVADYDNDGRDDVYITALEGDRLFHNLGNGKFADVTKAAGIQNANFGASAAWLDYDRDGKVDLFVANYVQWTPRTTCGARSMAPRNPIARRNPTRARARGCFTIWAAGNFEDVTVAAGVGDPTSKSLGVTVLDYNGDGWPDLFVANDTQPNKLYRNTGKGSFVESGMAAGVAYGEDGVARGAMGADAGDYDGSGRPHLLVGNFSNQMLGLYHNEGNGLFVDESPVLGGGPRQPAFADLRHILLRLRSGRQSRYLRRQRPYRRRDRPRAAQSELPAGAAAVSQLWAITSSRM